MSSRSSFNESDYITNLTRLKRENEKLRLKNQELKRNIFDARNKNVQLENYVDFLHTELCRQQTRSNNLENKLRQCRVSIQNKFVPSLLKLVDVSASLIEETTELSFTSQIDTTFKTQIVKPQAVQNCANNSNGIIQGNILASNDSDSNNSISDISDNDNLSSIHDTSSVCRDLKIYLKRLTSDSTNRQNESLANIRNVSHFNSTVIYPDSILSKNECMSQLGLTPVNTSSSTTSTPKNRSSNRLKGRKLKYCGFVTKRPNSCKKESLKTKNFVVQLENLNVNSLSRKASKNTKSKQKTANVEREIVSPRMESLKRRSRPKCLS